IALLTAAATFPLIFMGGLVTSHGAGMSVPDWPNSYGYNMFTFPPSKWVGGIFYEHTHRLMGVVVGMLAIALAIAAWRTESRNWARWLCYSVLGAVMFQGALGGLRVVLVDIDLAVVHACFAQTFFCLAAGASIVTSKWWLNAPDLSQSDAVFAGRRLIFACAFALVAIYAQLIVGAMMRHYQAGLAVPDFPLAYGQLIPATDSAAMQTINADRAWNLNLPHVTAAQIWLHMGHRFGAVVVTLALGAAITIALRHHRRERELVRPALLLIALLLAQITLGVLTVLWRKPADVASAHVAVGALTLVTAFVMTIRASRLYARRRELIACSAMDFDAREVEDRLAAA
ncbi:MAG: heme a synthase, partial [Phycisphaerales bacterium]|nr:heme a synthase [Phycisphaerales bacterium]